MKGVNNFQIAKVDPQDVLGICMNFCQFQPGVAYKSVAYKKSVLLSRRYFFPKFTLPYLLRITYLVSRTVTLKQKKITIS